MVMYNPKGLIATKYEGEWRRAMSDPEYGSAFKDDFLQGLPASGTAIGAGVGWAKTETTSNSVVNAAEVYGVVKCLTRSTNETAKANLYQGVADGTAAELFYQNYGLIVDFKIKFHGFGADATSIASVGMINIYNDAFAGTTQRAGFTVLGSANYATYGTLLVATDNNSTDTGGVATGQTLLIDTWYVLSIDMSQYNKIKFYLNGVDIATLNATEAATTFAVGSGIAFAPWLGVAKASSSTDVWDLRCDWVKILQTTMK